MTSDANKRQPVKRVPVQPMTYEEFATRYEFLLNDRNEPYQQRREQWQALEERYPKFYHRYMLLNGFGALAEGSRVWIMTRKHSRTGYRKFISVYTFVPTGTEGVKTAALTYHVAKLMGYTVHDYEGFHVLWTDDCDREFVAHLSQALFGVDRTNALQCEVL